MVLIIGASAPVKEPQAYPGHDTREFETTPEQLAELQEQILIGTDWLRLIQDVQMHDKDALHKRERQRPEALKNMRYLLSMLAAQPRSLDGHMPTDLQWYYQELSHLGYITAEATAENTKLRNEASEPLQNPGAITDYIQHWKEQTDQVMKYMSIDRRRPLDKFDTGVLLDNISGFAAVAGAPGERIAPVTARLWEQVLELTKGYDEHIPPQPDQPMYHTYHTELLNGRELSLTEYNDIIKVAIASYPPALMRKLQGIALMNERKPMKVNGQDLLYVGEARQDVPLINLYITNIIDLANAEPIDEPDEQQRKQVYKQKLHKIIEWALDHELAHIVHFVAPIAWLRRWDDLSRAKPLKGLSDYATLHSDGGEQGAELEQLAELIQIYRSDPVEILRHHNGGVEYFSLLQGLLGTYSESAVDKVMERIDAKNPLLDYDDFEYIRRTLTESRQQKLVTYLQQIGHMPSSARPGKPIPGKHRAGD